jgi:hypothetical protein
MTSAANALPGPADCTAVPSFAAYPAPSRNASQIPPVTRNNRAADQANTSHPREARKPCSDVGSWMLAFANGSHRHCARTDDSCDKAGATGLRLRPSRRSSARSRRRGWRRHTLAWTRQLIGGPAPPLEPPRPFSCRARPDMTWTSMNSHYALAILHCEKRHSARAWRRVKNP